MMTTVLVLRNRSALFDQFRRSYRSTRGTRQCQSLVRNEEFEGLIKSERNGSEEVIELHTMVTNNNSSPAWHNWLDQKQAIERFLQDLYNAGITIYLYKYDSK